MQAPQDQYVQVGTIRTRYWAGGDSARAVVLIHGLGGYIENWLSNLNILASPFRFYALDLVGHGLTDKPSFFSYAVADLTQFVKDLMQQLKIEHASLIGHSLGGAISLRLANDSPEMIDKLIVVDGAGLGREVNFFPPTVSLLDRFEMLSRPRSRPSVAKSLSMAVADPSVITDDLIETECRMSAQPGSQLARLKTAWAMFNLSGQRKTFYEPTLSSLPSISQPALIVWGSLDPLLPVAHSQVAAARMPNASLRIFDQCGHLPFLEHPDEFNQMAVEFLSR